MRGAGVELDDTCVISCVRRGVEVIQQNLEDGLALFDDKQFDTVVLSQTLQSMHRTEHILREMARVARHGVVSFPNFGYWPHGWAILRGRMPVTGRCLTSGTTRPTSTCARCAISSSWPASWACASGTRHLQRGA